MAMPVKIVFVVPKDCKDQQECDPSMIEAYNIANNYDIYTKWIRCDDPNIDGMETNKTDVIVFQEMKGDFYKKVVHSKSVSVVSPLVLLQCLKNAKTIPQSESPLVSLAMENCVVVCSCLPKESKRDLKAKVQAMAGIFCLQLVSDTTFLITDGVKSEKYTRAVQEGMKIMTVEFIDALWETGKTRIVHAHNAEFQKYKCPPFLNLNICSTGFSKQETHIQTLVEANGGCFSAAMDVSKTDILVCKSSNSTSSVKYKSAIKYKIDCVTENWIVDSAEKGVALPNLKDYAVKAATSTPTKQDDFDAPNMSQVSMIMTHSTQFCEVVPKFVDQTVNMSYVPSTPYCGQTSAVDSQDEIIDKIDIKKAKAAGLFLDGCVIYVAGFQAAQKEKIGKILNFSGATTCFSLNDQITHVICKSVTCVEFKQITNKHFPCAIVNINWLVNSMNEQMPVNVDEYLITSGVEASVDGPGIGDNSPLSKKALNFFRSDVTLLKKDENLIAPEPTVDQNDEDLQRYFAGTQSRDSVDDVLAAFSIPASSQTQPDATNHQKSQEIPTNNISSPSIDITMGDSEVGIFSNLKFMIVNHPQEEEMNIAEYIKELQGTVVGSNFKGIPDYAIVPVANQNLQLTASNVVTSLWVTECGEQKRLITDMQYYHLPFAKVTDVLNGLVITLGGFKRCEKEFLSHVVDQLGGVPQDWMSRYTIPEKNSLATTHLILAEPSGKKYQGALKWGIPVVSKDWLLQCAEQGKLLSEHMFYLGDGKENHSIQSKSQGIKTKDTESFESSIPAQKQQKITSVNNELATGTPNQRNINMISSITPASVTFRRLGLSSANDSPIPTTSQHDDAQTPNRKPQTYSQITPVNEIMARVRKICGDVQTPGDCTPKTPCQRMDDSIATPETPYGAVFENPPPPELRKKWKRWIDKMPEPQKSPGTPLSEIKRQFWKKYYETHPRSCSSNDPNVPKDLHVQFASQQDCADMEIQENVDTTVQDSEINNSVLAKLDELEKHMAIGSDSSGPRRQSMKKMECDADVLPRKYTQPMSVGWDEDMIIPGELQMKSKPKHFMISGIDADERGVLAEQLEKLGATTSALNNFDPSATHLLCAKLNRNEKLLASMASGLWILHISYATDSATAGKLLNEEDYEFDCPNGVVKFKLDSDSVQKATAAKYWRQEISRRGYGAFHDIRAIVFANKKEPMIRVLQAGGAMIVDASPPFDENISATHCFLELKNMDITPFFGLAKQGILCVNILYINDFLQRIDQDVNNFILPAFMKYY